MLCMSGFQGFAPTHFLRKTSMLFSPLVKSEDVSLQLPKTNTVSISFQFSGLSVLQQKIQSVLRQ